MHPSDQLNLIPLLQIGVVDDSMDVVNPATQSPLLLFRKLFDLGNTALGDRPCPENQSYATAGFESRASSKSLTWTTKDKCPKSREFNEVLCLL